MGGKAWTDFEDSILKIYYEDKGNEFCSAKLNRSKDSIKCRVKKLGLKRKNSPTGQKSFYQYKKELSKKFPEYKCLEVYIDNNTPILHKHSCGYRWRTRPRAILSGNGCPMCSNTGFNPIASAYLYFIKLTELGLYKIGIAKNLEARLRQLGTSYNLLKTLYFNKGTEARDLEQSILKKYRKYLFNSGNLLNGNTETLLLEESITMEILDSLQ
jgi:hypothetical protein